MHLCATSDQLIRRGFGVNGYSSRVLVTCRPAPPWTEPPPDPERLDVSRRPLPRKSRVGMLPESSQGGAYPILGRTFRNSEDARNLAVRAVFEERQPDDLTM